MELSENIRERIQDARTGIATNINVQDDSNGAAIAEVLECLTDAVDMMFDGLMHGYFETTDKP